MYARHYGSNTNTHTHERQDAVLSIKMANLITRQRMCECFLLYAVCYIYAVLYSGQNESRRTCISLAVFSHRILPPSITCAHTKRWQLSAFVHIFPTIDVVMNSQTCGSGRGGGSEECLRAHLCGWCQRAKLAAAASLRCSAKNPNSSSAGGAQSLCVAVV